MSQVYFVEPKQKAVQVSIYSVHENHPINVALCITVKLVISKEQVKSTIKEFPAISFTFIGGHSEKWVYENTEDGTNQRQQDYEYIIGL